MENPNININVTVIPLERYEALIASERDAQLLKNILMQKAAANEPIYAGDVKSLVSIFCKDGEAE